MPLAKNIFHSSSLDYEMSIIETKGLRMGDFLTISPYCGKSRKIKLNRPKYIFDDHEDDIILTDKPYVFSIPSPINNHFKLELCLSYPKGHERKDELARYSLRSLCHTPFRINGIYAYEAIVERGDVVDCGYSRFLFEPKSSNQINNNTSKSLKREFVNSDIEILIEGETGVGKTQLAKKIHQESGRAGKFVHLCLSSFSSGLIESELFGHRKGSFTGAVNDKKGAILESFQGTLFLDEIDSLPIDIQTKILLFLDNKKFRQVGANSESSCDTRLIFASGSNCLSLVKSGRFRKDFYYRLASGYRIQLKSLREDPDLIRQHCHNFEKEQHIIIDSKVIDFYCSLSWPGNLRELYSHLKKKKILCSKGKIIFDREDEILEFHQSKMPILGEAKDAAFLSLDEVKRRYITRAYHYFGGSINRTGQAVKVTAATVRKFVT